MTKKPKPATAPSFDLLKMTGLKRSKKPANKYATIHQRMMAASIDSLIILMLFAPLMDMVVLHYFPITAFDVQAVDAQINSGAPASQALKVFFQNSQESGVFRRWWINSSLQFAVFFIMSAVCWYFWSATPGKMITRIKVVDAATEQPISLKQILLRILGYCVVICSGMIGFFWAGFDKRHQGWHDKMAGTVLLHTPLSFSEFMAWARGLLPKR